MSGN
ncbi:unnamed protein product [Linum tenue]|jgi:hypothetical protein